MKTALIVGASGLVGTAAANAFLNAGWKVIAASRRYPELLHGEFMHKMSMNLNGRSLCLRIEIESGRLQISTLKF